MDRMGRPVDERPIPYNDEVTLHCCPERSRLAGWPTTSVVADDRRTVGLHLATGEREGRTLEDREVLVFHVRDGKVVEARQYIEDQYAYDEFFS
jgi:ketosteroid isomerase-like protein